MLKYIIINTSGFKKKEQNRHHRRYKNLYFIIQKDNVHNFFLNYLLGVFCFANYVIHMLTSIWITRVQPYYEGPHYQPGHFWWYCSNILLDSSFQIIECPQRMFEDLSLQMSTEKNFAFCVVGPQDVALLRDKMFWKYFSQNLHGLSGDTILLDPQPDRQIR